MSDLVHAPSPSGLADEVKAPSKVMVIAPSHLRGDAAALTSTLSQLQLETGAEIVLHYDDEIAEDPFPSIVVRSEDERDPDRLRALMKIAAPAPTAPARGLTETDRECLRLAEQKRARKAAKLRAATDRSVERSAAAHGTARELNSNGNPHD